MRQQVESGVQWVRVTRQHNIPLREGRAVHLGDHEIAIFNLGDRALAVENRCPHRGGPLADGLLRGNSVVCPLHAERVCLETGRPARVTGSHPCVRTFPAMIADGDILVNLWREEVCVPMSTQESVPAAEPMLK